MPAFTQFQQAFSALPGPVRAGIWITIAGASFTSVMAIARHLSSEIHVFEIVFFRAVLGLPFLVPYMIRTGPRVLHTTKTGLYLMRSLGAFVGLVCFFYAATLVPLADISAIGFTRPALSTIAAMIFLGEIAMRRRWTAIGISVIGALFVVRPGFEALNAGVLFAFGAVVAQVQNTVVIKKLTYTEPPDTIAIYQSLYLAPMAFAAAFWVWTWPTWEQFAWLMLMGAIGTITQRSIVRSYAAADASVVVALDFIRLPVAALIGLVAFGQVPSPWVWVGGAIIIASTVLLTRRESRDTSDPVKPPSS
jgi:drug/metabolite transporter (DMT)-like permease